MPLVPTVRTPVTAAEAEHALRAAWRRRFGERIPNGALRNLLALWDLETDIGRKMFNNNWGNQIVLSDAPPFWLGDDSGNLRRFRSFRTREAGADGFLALLTRASRAHWRRGMLSGNPRDFAHALKGNPEKNLAAYYEAPEKLYTRRLVTGWTRYSHLGGGGSHGFAYGAITLAALSAAAAVYFHRKSRRRRVLRR